MNHIAAKKLIDYVSVIRIASEIIPYENHPLDLNDEDFNEEFKSFLVQIIKTLFPNGYIRKNGNTISLRLNDEITNTLEEIENTIFIYKYPSPALDTAVRTVIKAFSELVSTKVIKDRRFIYINTPIDSLYVREESIDISIEKLISLYHAITNATKLYTDDTQKIIEFLETKKNEAATKAEIQRKLLENQKIKTAASFKELKEELQKDQPKIQSKFNQTIQRNALAHNILDSLSVENTVIKVIERADEYFAVPTNFAGGEERHIHNIVARAQRTNLKNIISTIEGTTVSFDLDIWLSNNEEQTQQPVVEVPKDKIMYNPTDGTILVMYKGEMHQFDTYVKAVGFVEQVGANINIAHVEIFGTDENRIIEGAVVDDLETRQSAG